MKVKEGELPRGRVGTGRGENGERKDRRSSRLADTMMCKRCLEIPSPRKLL